MPKRIGQAHKDIGRLIISRLSPSPNPAAVGTGTGSDVRPSASKREVLLRVGGKHRAGKTPQMQWGRRPARVPGRSAPKRPFIKRTAENNFDDIGDAYLKAISDAMRNTFADTDP